MQTKKDNGVANITGDFLCRLRRIAIDFSVIDFKEWKMYRGKLNNWFEGNTYFKIRTKIKQHVY